MNPLISVIMPVYNNEIYFPKAVESVLSQGFENFELIIVDDGSTDNTPVIADSFAERDSRVRVIHQENQWIYQNMNNGIAQARGEYVYILNSDDKLYPDALQKLADIVAEHNPDVVWTLVITNHCDMNQNVIIFDYHNITNVITQDVLFKNINEVRENGYMFFKLGLASNQANLYRTSIALKHGFRNDYCNADQFFNLSVIPDISCAYLSSAPIYEHFIYENGQNASMKYNASSHDMFDEYYYEFVNTFKMMGSWNKKVEDYIATSRLGNFVYEMNLYDAVNCELSAEEKIVRIFSHNINQLVYDCAVKVNKVDWLEEKIFFFCIELFSKVPISTDFDYYFIYDMLAALYGEGEITDEKRKIIENGIYHQKNPLNIGKYTYNDMLSKG